ncbi:MAG: response regulator [Lachnospiraceae bacterium]|nr:response regulator [Lachnospiraceae bacterium]
MMKEEKTGRSEWSAGEEQVLQIHELMDALVQYVHPLATDKNLHFRYRAEQISASELVGDRESLFGILAELLENAVKYTPAGGDVILCVRELLRTGDKLTLEFYVQDNGVGFTPEEKSRIFSREPQYAQVQEAPRRPVKPEEQSEKELHEREMTLAEVMLLSKKLGASLSCESGRGLGTIVRLIVTLPSNNPAGALPLPDTGRDLYSFGGKKILLAEDHPLNMEIARMMLERVGIEVETAANGREAVDRFAQEDGNFDLILMDIRMPVMDGIEAVRVIRMMDVPGADSIPIIALTASAYEEDSRRISDAGMNETLLKPIDPEKMYRVLAKYLF